MKARIIFEVENPNENATKEEFESWINFQIGKNSELPHSILTNENLELIDAFADKEIIENASIEIIEARSVVEPEVKLPSGEGNPHKDCGFCKNYWFTPYDYGCLKKHFAIPTLMSSDISTTKGCKDFK